MASGLIDTVILIDYLRGYPPSGQWIHSMNDLDVSRAVLLELIEGTPDKRAYRKVVELVGQFELVETITEDMQWATDMLVQYRHSHNIDVFDCLIAASSFRLGVPLYTRNRKHFTPLLRDSAIVPY